MKAAISGFSLLMASALVLTLLEYVCFDQNFYWEQFHKRASINQQSNFWVWHQQICQYCDGTAADLPRVFSDSELSFLYQIKEIFRELHLVRYGIIAALFLWLIVLMSFKKKALSTFLVHSFSLSGILGWVFFITLMLIKEKDHHSLLLSQYLSDCLLVQMYPRAVLNELSIHFINTGLAFFSVILIVSVPLWVLREERIAVHDSNNNF